MDKRASDCSSLRTPLPLFHVQRGSAPSGKSGGYALVCGIECAELKVLLGRGGHVVELQRVRVQAAHLQCAGCVKRVQTHACPGAPREKAASAPRRACSVLRTSRMSLLQLSTSASIAMSLTCAAAAHQAALHTHRTHV